MSLKQAIHVLLVEDSALSAALIEQFLKTEKSGHFIVNHVDSLRSCRAWVQTHSPDVILLDLSLPDSEGFATVAAVRSFCRTVPIVIMTVTDDEHFAILSLQSGAQDYLVKQRDRGPQIARAIRYAIERHQIAQRIRESEQRFRDFAEVAADWFWETDIDSYFTFLSNRVESSVGRSVIDLLGQPLVSLLKGGVHTTVAAEDHQHTIARHRAFRNFVHRIDANDSIRYIRMSGEPRFDDSGTFLGYRGVGTDVTEQIAAEQFGQQMLSIMVDGIEAFPYGIAIFNAHDRLVISNNRLHEPFRGCGDLFVANMGFADIMRGVAERGLFPAAIPRLQEWVNEQIQAGSIFGVALRLVRNDGTTVIIRAYPTQKSGILRVFSEE